MGKLSETLLVIPDFLVLISCCLAARSCYYRSRLCLSLGLWGLALPSCSRPSDVDS
jgi:hypothetical protein